MLSYAKPVSDETAKKYATKAREYDTPDGKRLNVSAIIVKHRISFSTFHDRQRRGWSGLNNQPLESKPGYYTSSGCIRGKTEEATYLATDVEKALQSPLEDDDRFFADGKWRLTYEGTAKRLGVCVDTVRGRDGKNPYLDDNKIKTEDGESFVSVRKRHPRKGRKVKTFTEDVVNLVKKKMQEVAQGRFADADGVVRLSPDQTLAELRVAYYKKGNKHGRLRGKKPSRHTLWLWRTEGCRHLGGRNLDGKQYAFIRPKKGGAPEYWHLEEHVTRIKESLLLLAAGKTFDGVFNEPEEEGGTRYAVRKAAEVSGCSMPCLYQYIKGFPPDLAEALLPIFPDRRLPSALRPVPDLGDLEILTITANDLVKLKKGIRKVFRSAASAIGNLHSGEDLFERYGVHTVREKVLVSRLLRFLREQGMVEAQGILREAGGRGWGAPLFYDPEQLDRFLDGQNIVEVARQLENAVAAAEAGEAAENDSGAEGQPPVQLQTGSAGNGRGGRPLSEQTRQIHKACYEKMAAGLFRPTIIRQLRAEFSDPAYVSTLPKDEATVTTYARRWAKDPKNNLPWPIQRRRA